MAVETSQLTESLPTSELKTPEKVSTTTPSTSPPCSRYGRMRKPKLSADFVAHDKNVKNFLSPSVSHSDTSVNGEVPSASKRKSTSRKKSEKNSELDGTSSLCNDIRSFFVNSNTLHKGDAEATVKAETPLRAEILTPDSTAKSGKRGRKRKIQTPSMKETFMDLLPSNSESSENSGAENVDPAAKSDCPAVTTFGGPPLKPMKKQGPKPKLTLLSETAASSIPSNRNLEMENCASSENAAMMVDRSAETVTTPLQSVSGDTKLSEDVSTLSVSTPTSASASLSPRPHFGSPYSEFLGDAEKSWSVGDVVWGSIGKHPYWPSIIMMDPVSKTHSVEKAMKRGTGLCKTYFLQFCGDNGRHSWLYSKNLLEFIDKQQFWNLQEKLARTPRNKPILARFTVKPPKDAWDRAVAEAEYLLSLSREDRIQHFQRLYPMEAKRTKKDLLELLMEEESPKPSTSGEPASCPQDSESSTSPHSIGSPSGKKITIVKSNGKYKVKATKGRKALKLSLKEKMLPNKKLMLLKKKKKLKMQLKKEMKNKVKRAYKKRKMVENADAVKNEKKPGSLQESAESEVENGVGSAKKVKPEKSVVKKRKKKQKQEFRLDFDVYCSKNFDRIADEHPQLKDKEIEKYLQKMWLEMDETQKLKYKSRLVKEESSADEEECEVSAADSEAAGSDSGSADSPNKKASPLPIVEAVSKVKKNNILFRGFKNERVCAVCEVGGETFRCQGFCYRFFHKDCIPKDSETLSEENPALAPKTESEVVDSVETVDAKGTAEKVGVGKKEEKGKGKNSDKASVGANFQCRNCILKKIPACFECGFNVAPNTNEEERIKCSIPCCGRYFHKSCLLKWPQAILIDGNRRKDSITGQILDKVLTCPQHVCHTCVSDNPGVVKERSVNEKQIVKCIKCPTAYHTGNYCVPAGSKILTSIQIICPRHYKRHKGCHINANWCFICSVGGDLICCDLCPGSFHAQCLNMTPDEYEAGFTCEECKTGRFPLFGEIAWVKLGQYRWWPAQILFPHEIPENIMNKAHSQGEFAVRFFGSDNYYWISRGRVFLYQEGDSGGKVVYSKSIINNEFKKAVSEASAAHKQWCAAKAQREEDARQGMVLKPPHYVKINRNKPVGNVKPVELNISGLTACECDPQKENPCASDNECLNRMLMVECNPLVCRASERCHNQRFEKRLYPPLEPFRTEKRGWGLRCLTDIKKGDFVIEYVGEIIDEAEYKRRIERMKVNNDENFYFLTIDSNRMVDAGPKGNVARFMNHSCDPNCETQKWTVNGDTRVGLFALKDIPQNSELVFNYNLDTGTAEKKTCFCGASTCRGFIGAKKIDKVLSSGNNSTQKQRLKVKRRGKENKKVRRKRVTSLIVEDDFCFICDKGGELIVCNNKRCPKAYHLECIGKKSYPKGNWLCPWHLCDVCGKRKVFRCGFCVSSYCKEHKTGNIKLDPDRGLCCKKHWDDEYMAVSDNLSSQSFTFEDGMQVTVSTPKADKMSQSILSDDLGSPISGQNSASETAANETKSLLKHARCNLNFDREKPAKRRKFDPKRPKKFLEGKSTVHAASNLTRKQGRVLPHGSNLLKPLTNRDSNADFCFSPIENYSAVPFKGEVSNALLKKRGRPRRRDRIIVWPKVPKNRLVMDLPESQFPLTPRPRKSTGCCVITRDFDSSHSSSDEMPSPTRKWQKRLSEDCLSALEINDFIGICADDISSLVLDDVSDLTSNASHHLKEKVSPEEPIEVSDDLKTSRDLPKEVSPKEHNEVSCDLKANQKVSPEDCNEVNSDLKVTHDVTEKVSPEKYNQIRDDLKAGNDLTKKVSPDECDEVSSDLKTNQKFSLKKYNDLKVSQDIREKVGPEDRNKVSSDLKVSHNAKKKVSLEKHNEVRDVLKASYDLRKKASPKECDEVSSLLKVSHDVSKEVSPKECDEVSSDFKTNQKVTLEECNEVSSDHKVSHDIREKVSPEDQNEVSSELKISHDVRKKVSTETRNEVRDDLKASYDLRKKVSPEEFHEVSIHLKANQKVSLEECNEVSSNFKVSHDIRENVRPEDQNEISSALKVSHDARKKVSLENHNEAREDLKASYDFRKKVSPKECDEDSSLLKVSHDVSKKVSPKECDDVSSDFKANQKVTFEESSDHTISHDIREKVSPEDQNEVNSDLKVSHDVRKKVSTETLNEVRDDLKASYDLRKKVSPEEFEEVSFDLKANQEVSLEECSEVSRDLSYDIRKKVSLMKPNEVSSNFKASQNQEKKVIPEKHDEVSGVTTSHDIRKKVSFEECDEVSSALKVSHNVWKKVSPKECNEVRDDLKASYDLRKKVSSKECKEFSGNLKANLSLRKKVSLEERNEVSDDLKISHNVRKEVSPVKRSEVSSDFKVSPDHRKKVSPEERDEVSGNLKASHDHKKNVSLEECHEVTRFLKDSPDVMKKVSPEEHNEGRDKLKASYDLRKKVSSKKCKEVSSDLKSSHDLTTKVSPEESDEISSDLKIIHDVKKEVSPVKRNEVSRDFKVSHNRKKKVSPEERDEVSGNLKASNDLKKTVSLEECHEVTSLLKDSPNVRKKVSPEDHSEGRDELKASYDLRKKVSSKKCEEVSSDLKPSHDLRKKVSPEECDEISGDLKVNQKVSLEEYSEVSDDLKIIHDVRKEVSPVKRNEVSCDFEVSHNRSKKVSPEERDEVSDNLKASHNLKKDVSLEECHAVTSFLKDSPDIMKKVSPEERNEGIDELKASYELRKKVSSKKCEKVSSDLKPSHDLRKKVSPEECDEISGDLKVNQKVSLEHSETSDDLKIIHDVRKEVSPVKRNEVSCDFELSHNRRKKVCHNRRKKVSPEERDEVSGNLKASHDLKKNVSLEECHEVTSFLKYSPDVRKKVSLKGHNEGRDELKASYDLRKKVNSKKCEEVSSNLKPSHDLRKKASPEEYDKISSDLKGNQKVSLKECNEVSSDLKVSPEEGNEVSSDFKVSHIRKKKVSPEEHDEVSCDLKANHVECNEISSFLKFSHDVKKKVSPKKRNEVRDNLKASYDLRKKVSSKECEEVCGDLKPCHDVRKKVDPEVCDEISSNLKVNQKVSLEECNEISSDLKVSQDIGKKISLVKDDEVSSDFKVSHNRKKKVSLKKRDEVRDDLKASYDLRKKVSSKDCEEVSSNFKANLALRLKVSLERCDVSKDFKTSHSLKKKVRVEDGNEVRGELKASHNLRKKASSEECSEINSDLKEKLNSEAVITKVAFDTDDLNNGMSRGICSTKDNEDLSSKVSPDLSCEVDCLNSEKCDAMNHSGSDRLSGSFQKNFATFVSEGRNCTNTEVLNLVEDWNSDNSSCSFSKEVSIDQSNIVSPGIMPQPDEPTTSNTVPNLAASLMNSSPDISSVKDFTGLNLKPFDAGSTDHKKIQNQVQAQTVETEQNSESKKIQRNFQSLVANVNRRFENGNLKVKLSSNLKTKRSQSESNLNRLTESIDAGHERLSSSLCEHMKNVSDPEKMRENSFQLSFISFLGDCHTTKALTKPKPTANILDSEKLKCCVEIKAKTPNGIKSDASTSTISLPKRKTKRKTYARNSIVPQETAQNLSESNLADTNDLQSKAAEDEKCSPSKKFFLNSEVKSTRRTYSLRNSVTSQVTTMDAPEISAADSDSLNSKIVQDGKCSSRKGKRKSSLAPPDGKRARR